MVEFEQPFRGLNSIDYSVTNTGTLSATYGLFAAVSYEQPDSEPLINERETSRILGPIEPGQRVLGRLFETELGLGETVHVEFHCFDEDPTSGAVCSGDLEFVVLIRQVECRVDIDCSTREQCDNELGICRSEEANSATGCRTIGQHGGPIAIAVGLVCGVAWLGARRRRARGEA